MSLPATVPGITVIETLAYGGFAVVYRARQESVGREVALKVDNRLAHDERDRRRFLREAHAAGQLSDHPNVISIYDAGITPEGRPYLVMELCPGGSLAERVRRNGPLPAAEVRDIGVKIADALQCAHDAGVLHRDVKPANVLINRFGSAGLADFGMAASFAGLQQVSATLEALTPAFAPPEVFRHEVPTTAVDVYGLAATLYCLLSGRPPRWPAEGHPSIASIIGFHEDPVRDVPGVPAALTAVIRKSLAPDAADRHPSAAALRDALAGVALEVPTGEFGVLPAGPPRSAETAGAVDAMSSTGSGGLLEQSSGRAARRRGGRHLAAVSAAGHTSVERVAPASAEPRAVAASEQLSRRASSMDTPRARQAPMVQPAAEELTPPRRLAFSEELRPEGPRTVVQPVPAQLDPRGVWVGRPRLAVLAAVAAAVLGVVSAVAMNSRPTGNDTRSPAPDRAAGGIGALPTPTDASGPPPTGSAATPSASPSSAASKPPPQLRLRTADPNIISGLGLGPFRVGELAQPLLAANLARHPDSDTPCPAAAQLLSTDPRYRQQFQKLSAHTVNGRIVHVTIFTEVHGTKSGLRVGSTLADITTTAPQAQQFGSFAPSFLVRDGANALLFVVRNAVTMAIVTGSESELTRIAEELGRQPDNLAPLC